MEPSMWNNYGFEEKSHPRKKKKSEKFKEVINTCKYCKAPRARSKIQYQSTRFLPRLLCSNWLSNL